MFKRKVKEALPEPGQWRVLKQGDKYIASYAMGNGFGWHDISDWHSYLVDAEEEAISYAKISLRRACPKVVISEGKVTL